MTDSDLIKDWFKKNLSFRDGDASSTELLVLIYFGFPVASGQEILKRVERRERESEEQSQSVAR